MEVLEVEEVLEDEGVDDARGPMSASPKGQKHKKKKMKHKDGVHVVDEFSKYLGSEEFEEVESRRVCVVSTYPLFFENKGLDEKC